MISGGWPMLSRPWRRACTGGACSMAACTPARRRGHSDIAPVAGGRAGRGVRGRTRPCRHPWWPGRPARPHSLKRPQARTGPPGRGRLSSPHGAGSRRGSIQAGRPGRRCACSVAERPGRTMAIEGVGNELVEEVFQRPLRELPPPLDHLRERGEDQPAVAELITLDGECLRREGAHLGTLRAPARVPARWRSSTRAMGRGCPAIRR